MKISKKATTIAVINQKGGTGKTTTCENLGVGLAMEGKKVLLVDADPQGSLTVSMGWQNPDALPTTLSTLMQKAMNDQCIPPGEGVLHHAEGVDLIPANIELAGLEVALVNTMSREKVMKSVLESAKREYDYILIDCTPSLGMLTVNALAAADSALIPVQAQYLSAKGLEQLLQTVQKVRRQINPKLKIEGILLTMTDSRTIYGQQISHLIRQAYGKHLKVFDQTIPRSVRAAETSTTGKSIFQYDPKGKVAEAYARKLKKKAKMQGRKGSKTAKSSVQEPTAPQNAGDSGVSSNEGGSNWLSRWRQKHDIRQGYYAAARSGGTATQTAGGKKAASSGASAARSGVEQVVDKGKSVVSTAVNGLMTAAKSNAHVLVIVGVFLLLILMVMSGFSSCGILFSGGTQVSGQTIYTAEDRDIRGAEQDYKKLEKELDKKIKRTPQEHPGFNEYQYHLDPIEHDPWQLASFLSTLYDDYTRSEVQGKLKEIFEKQYKLTTWVEVQIRYKTVWVISPAGIPVPTQVPYEYKIFHTKLENRGLEVVIREELTEDQWQRYQIFQDTLGGRPYLFNGGLPPGGSDGSGTPGIDYTVPAEALTDSEFAAIYEEAKKYVGTPYVWGGSTPETGFDCSGYVCWVYNQAGYDVGRTTANGLWQKSQHISEAEAKPGDLVFFKGTYDTPGMSHVGIYLGNGKMVSAGDPIKYADIHSSYWQQYLAGFGRLSK